MKGFKEKSAGAQGPQSCYDLYKSRANKALANERKHHFAPIAQSEVSQVPPQPDRKYDKPKL